MTGATVCSGIGAPEQAAPEIEWLWHAEIEPFPCAVMAERHPQSVNLGDITAPDFIERAQSYGPLDVLVAGTPCQAFSVAGLRQSLSDARGNLTLRFVDAVHAIRPRYAVWENVPGVLSTHDNAFGCLLGGLVGDNAPLIPFRGKWTNAGVVDGPLGAAAWRVLDAQYFGLAQRRKRVFLVFRSGATGKHPAEILFEWDSMRRDSPPSREAGQGATFDVAPSLTGSGRGVERGGESRGQDPVIACYRGIRPNGPHWPEEYTDASGQRRICCSCGGPLPCPLAKYSDQPKISMCLNGGAMNRIDAESETLIAAPVRTRPYADNASHESQLIVAHALRGEGFDASKDGTGRGTPLVPMAFDTTQITSKANHSNPQPGDPCQPITSAGHPPAIAFNLRGREGGAMPEPTDVASLRSASGGSSRTYVGVRRLVPVETERLQGMADGYTAIEYNGKPAKDGPRYKAIGNSMAVPVLSWIFRRIDCQQDQP